MIFAFILSRVFRARLALGDLLARRLQYFVIVVSHHEQGRVERGGCASSLTHVSWSARAMMPRYLLKWKHLLLLLLKWKRPLPFYASQPNCVTRVRRAFSRMVGRIVLQ
jgi:hypothetical protein